MVHKYQKSIIIDFIHNIGSFEKNFSTIMIFIKLGLFSRPPIFLCSISDIMLQLLGIFPHTLEDIALIIVISVIDPREYGHRVNFLVTSDFTCSPNTTLNYD